MSGGQTRRDRGGQVGKSGTRPERSGNPLPSPLVDTSRLAIHTVTTKPWSIETAIDKYAAAGVRGISIWRDTLEGRKLSAVRTQMRDAGVTGVSLVRGGFFASPDEEKRKSAIEENRRCIREAVELGLPLIVLVCGSDPGQPLHESRRQIVEGLQKLAPEAAEAGVRLGIEPLHPMYADTRSAVNTLKQANDMCEAVGHSAVSVVVDVYHLWWDPELEAEIRRAAAMVGEHGLGGPGWSSETGGDPIGSRAPTGAIGALDAFHVCDWNVPTTDFLLDRGLMGEGCIPVREIRGWVEDSGFGGFIEVEIFSKRFWEMDQDEYLKRIVEAYLKYT